MQGNNVESRRYWHRISVAPLRRELEEDERNPGPTQRLPQRKAQASLAPPAKRAARGKR